MNRLFTVMVISFTVFLLHSLSLVAQSVRCDIVEGVYTVRIGDTFSSISRKLGVSIEQICQLNGLESNSRLSLGQKLIIMQPSETLVNPNQTVVVEGIYTVRSDDTFSNISCKLGMSIDQIRQLNSLESNSRLVVGQKLKVTQLSEISEQPNQAEVVEKIYYTVRSGDTFASISRKLSVSVDQIRQLNSLESNSRLVVGQKLKYN